LALATLFAYKVRSRHWMLALTIGSLLYFGFYRRGCICPVGAIQNVTEGLFNAGVGVPAAVLLFFLLPVVAALFFGRTFCASVCPLGAVQDVVLAKPVAVPVWLDHALGLLAYVYLGLAVLLAATQSVYIICQYDPFVSLFRLVDWPGMEGGGPVHALVLAAIFVGAAVFIGRPYCRYLCPYGALLRVVSRLSWKRVTITPDRCVQCTLCADACPFGAIRSPTAPAPGVPRTAGKTRLAAAILLVPVLGALGGYLGYRLGAPLSRAHAQVRLSDRIRLEDAGAVEGTTDASDAFRATGRPAEDLHAEARAVTERFTGAWMHVDILATGTKILRLWVLRPGLAVWAGAFAGLVFAFKLVELSIRRLRTDWEADRAACVACGRCFASCPVERASRQGKGIAWKRM
ncbi:MAG: 4Fe-4S binding protein, partial [Planctomycetes bacterium]|nr:4Fe-4S binding protein [Planctomycetota bacterium]